MIKILYCEDEHMAIITRDTKGIQRLLVNTDLRQRFNLYRKINVYKINFDSDQLTDSAVMNIFKTSNAKRKSELFVKLY